jgi:ketosteroid isomerase-like protein
MRSGIALGMMVLAATAAACKPAETPEQRQTRMAAQADSARTAIQAGIASWVRYTNQNHPDSIATLFRPDGVVMPPDVPGATGKDSISARMRAGSIPGGTLSITSVNISVSDPIAVDRGVWSYALPAMGRTPAITLGGKYLSHWHHGSDAGWRVAEITWNNDSMLRPPMPPAAGRH